MCYNVTRAPRCCFLAGCQWQEGANQSLGEVKCGAGSMGLEACTERCSPPPKPACTAKNNWWDLFEDTGQHIVEEAGCDTDACVYPRPPGNDRCQPYPFFCCDSAYLPTRTASHAHAAAAAATQAARHLMPPTALFCSPSSVRKKLIASAACVFVPSAASKKCHEWCVQWIVQPQQQPAAAAAAAAAYVAGIDRVCQCRLIPTHFKLGARRDGNDAAATCPSNIIVTAWNGEAQVRRPTAASYG
jgi:hypothetical protein